MGIPIKQPDKRRVVLRTKYGDAIAIVKCFLTTDTARANGIPRLPMNEAITRRDQESMQVTHLFAWLSQTCFEASACCVLFLACWSSRTYTHVCKTQIIAMKSASFVHLKALMMKHEFLPANTVLLTG